MPTRKKIGLIGAGNIGGELASLAARNHSASDDRTLARTALSDRPPRPVAPSMSPGSTPGAAP